MIEIDVAESDERGGFDVFDEDGLIANFADSSVAEAVADALRSQRGTLAGEYPRQRGFFGGIL